MPQDLVTVGTRSITETTQLQLVRETGAQGRSVYEIECVPLWGLESICGRRREMEDEILAIPRFCELPIRMLAGDTCNKYSDQICHFFAVYDGHGGPQVAGFCRRRIHAVLEEELRKTRSCDLQVAWESVFTRCFNRVDGEIAGEMIPETVGSTAVVALICSSHVIVANCGDSRAVLCRGSQVIALSRDHKPNREDERTRIEAAEGRVIQWNGHRVFGVLSMSRAIGDGYLKRWVISEAEVSFTARSRDDECLIVASDGLWDVMSNEEACHVARTRIVWWHMKNDVAVERGGGVDPAAQAAAKHLVALAYQKGSRDNVSVIVVDLKARRRFKGKP